MKDNLHTPWSDVCDLYTLPDDQDAEGYGVAAPVKKSVYCNWQDGVSQSEFYLSQKAGMRASVSSISEAATTRSCGISRRALTRRR